MTEAGKGGDQLLVAIQKETAFIRVRERGSFKISKAMKQFGVSAIEHGVQDIVVDLHDCVGMDSTFMGVLAGLAFRLRKERNGVLYMVNLSSRTRGLLATLGLDQLVNPCMVGSTPEAYQTVLDQANHMDALQQEEANRHETAAMMLEAHENLVELSAENLPRFKDVLTFLRDDLKKAEAEAEAEEHDA